MNILFICGGLEPGQDGVGDYSRRLAGEIKRQGHTSSIIAINDVATDKIIEQYQNDNGEVIKVLRLPKSISWNNRFLRIDSWIKAENPNWISLQFVPFSFQEKGLPIRLALRLKKISRNCKWHIMFHELWVGKENFKFWILGLIQRRLIVNLFKTLKPRIVHTHLPIYYNDLMSIAIHAQKLPLFSNFEISRIPVVNNTNTFRIGFFNHVANDQRIYNFLISLHQQSLKKNLQLEILLIGGGRSIKSFGEKLQLITEFENNVVYTGFLKSEDITTQLSKCDIGVTPLAYSTLGKSGTSAAFLAEGIPVAVPINNERQNPFFDPQILAALVMRPDFDEISKASIAAKELKYKLSLSSIAEIFLNDLINNEKNG